MMKEKLKQLTDIQLTHIISIASEELRTRLQRKASEAATQKATGDVEQALDAIQPPTESDREYILYIKALLRRGEYIRADDRVRVAEIAQKFPAWVQRQGLPTQSNTGPWNAARKRFSTPTEREM